MTEEIMERLDILYGSNQITKKEKEETLEAIKIVQKDFLIDLEEEAAGMFVTHFSKALNRINSKEGIECTSDEVRDAIKDTPELKNYAADLLKEFLGTYDLPDGEISFIAMYIKLLLKS